MSATHTLHSWGSNPYVLELAKSKRSKCKGACKEAIAKGQPRFGSYVGVGNGSYSWRCLSCVTPKVPYRVDPTHTHLHTYTHTLTHTPTPSQQRHTRAHAHTHTFSTPWSTRARARAHTHTHTHLFCLNDPTPKHAHTHTHTHTVLTTPRFSPGPAFATPTLRVVSMRCVWSCALLH